MRVGYRPVRRIAMSEHQFTVTILAVIVVCALMGAIYEIIFTDGK
jgi:hypothetical protein